MPISLNTKETFESKVAPGVSYTIQFVSHKRRLDILLKTADINAKILELESELIPIQDDIQQAEEVAKTEPCTCSHESVEKEGDPPQHDEQTGRCRVKGCKCRQPQLDEELGGYLKYYSLLGKLLDTKVFQLYPEYIRVCVQSVQGLKIDDKPATIQSFLDEAPYDLVKELGDKIDSMMRMSTDELLGFKSPSTSGAQGDGKILSTDAPPVNNSNTTNPAAAPATSQS